MNRWIFREQRVEDVEYDGEISESESSRGGLGSSIKDKLNSLTSKSFSKADNFAKEQMPSALPVKKFFREILVHNF